MLVGKLHLHLPLRFLLVLLKPPMLLVNLPARMLREDAFATASSDASIKWSKTPRNKLVTIPFGSLTAGSAGSFAGREDGYRNVELILVALPMNPAACLILFRQVRLSTYSKTGSHPC